MLRLAQQADEADWLLSLEARTATAGAEELVLMAGSDGVQQQLASTFVIAATDLPAPGPARSPAVTQDQLPGAADRAFLPLLSELTKLPGDDCPKTLRPARDEYCVAVDLALEDDGYLFNFRVENGRIISNQCGRAPERSAPGRRRFRLVLDRESTVTFYALATRNVRTAQALRRLFNERGSGCDGSRRFEAAQWLIRLERIVDKTAAVHWQALELSAPGSELLAAWNGG
jgi:hypothetical protein